MPLMIRKIAVVLMICLGFCGDQVWAQSATTPSHSRALATPADEVSQAQSPAPSHAPSHHGERIWVGTWASAPVPPGGFPDMSDVSLEGFTNQTTRQIIHTSIGGKSVRVRLSNTFGDAPLTIGHATLALPLSVPAADLVAGSVKELRFAGRRDVTIPRGAQVLSDPIRMNVRAASDLVVSLYFPTATGPITWHLIALQTSYISTEGDHTADALATAFVTTSESSFVLAGVDVQTQASAAAVVTLGDSITDGFGSTTNTNRRWPDRLAERLIPLHWGVLNAGISGNQILSDGADIGLPGLGVNALARLDRDGLGQSNARVVIVALGVNDIQIANASADAITAGLRQLAVQGKATGRQMFVATIGPGEGSGLTAEQEQTRTAVNSYIRLNDDFDGVVDFDAVLRDPKHPTRLLAAYDSGDHLHPNDAGYWAMAQAVPVREFAKP